MLLGMLTYTVDGPIAWATLDRPERLNAMTRSLWDELTDAMARADADPEVRVVIFRGAGKAFSVGGDIEGFGDVTGVADRRAYLGEAMAAFHAIESASTPTIAAVHGYAMGGGCELTMFCDIVVADATAKFALPESGVGLNPGPGMVRGGDHLNLHWMKYMVLTGATLDADEARLAGLVNHVVPAGEHIGHAEELGRKIATRAPLAMAVGKRILDSTAGQGVAQAIEANTLLMGTDDHAEGIAAFTARRPAHFEGR
jgi:enoyl-CoA hydratase/carnithine racemase